MSALSNKALKFVASVKNARTFAASFGINVPGVDVDHKNTDPLYVAAYVDAYIHDLAMITARVEILWAESAQGKNEIDTRELAKLLKVVNKALNLSESVTRAAQDALH